jgi:hypothetical protein
MTDDPPYSDSNRSTDDTGVGSGRGSTTSIPRWVKVFVIIAIVLILLVVVMMLTGSHGPSIHTL